MADPVLLRSADKLVEMLRSDDPKHRQAALEEIYPDHHGVVLIELAPGKRSIATTQKCADVGGMFTTLVYSAQQYGKALGLNLNWIQDQEELAKAADKLVVVQDVPQ